MMSDSADQPGPIAQSQEQKQGKQAKQKPGKSQDQKQAGASESSQGRGHPRLIIGAMTGTSCDGIDVAAVQVNGHGLFATTQLLAQVSQPLGALGDKLRRVTEQVPLSAGSLMELNLQLSQLHVTVMRQLMKQLSPNQLNQGSPITNGEHALKRKKE